MGIEVCVPTIAQCNRVDAGDALHIRHREGLQRLYIDDEIKCLSLELGAEVLHSDSEGTGGVSWAESRCLVAEPWPGGWAD
jgi:hypothetical protein